MTQPDYKNGTKNQWRRTSWNRIVARVDDPRNALVLFLAGEKGLDIVEAERRGFKVCNMIAVERDPIVAKNLRARGLLVIEGDILQVLLTWSERKKVDVVMADFCGQITQGRVGKIVGICTAKEAFSSTVFCLNFLGAREVGDAKFRETLKGYANKTLYVWLSIARNFTWEWPDDARARLIGEIQGTRYAPQGYRYPSGRSEFHSCVFQNLRGHLSSTRRSTPNPEWVDFGEGHPQRRRTAAVLAHHTMRTA